MKVSVRKTKARKRKLIVAGLLILAGIGMTMAGCFILLSSPGGIYDSIGIGIGALGWMSFLAASEAILWSRQ